MGLLMGAIAGAAGAVEETTKYALRAMMDEEKAKRIAEFGSKLKSDEDLTTRSRNKADAAEERGRVAGLLSEPVPVSQGDGMLAPATGDESELTTTSREPTNDEMVSRALKAGDVKTAAEVGKLDDKDAANAIKVEIAKGRFENALKIAEMKGEFAMMLGELKASAAGGNSKATELMRNWEYLTKQKGMSDKQAGESLLSGKVGEYITTATESFDDKGNKVVTTKKTKPTAEEKPAPASGRVRVYVPGKGFVDQKQ